MKSQLRDYQLSPAVCKVMRMLIRLKRHKTFERTICAEPEAHNP